MANQTKCDHHECTAPGEYRAPKSRHTQEGYFYFCLEHIRSYNKTWDYFKGMSPDEVMAHRISDITWRRPTWNAKGQARLHQVSEHPFCDAPIGLIHVVKTPGSFPPPRRHSPEEKAAKALSLEYPFSQESLKKRYLYLVKTYHPDRNSGCKKSEETLKQVTVAYKILTQYINRY